MNTGAGRAHPSDLGGMVALVTGAAHGIGAGIATALAEAGAAVFLVDIDLERGRAYASSLRDAGHAATFLHADVTDAAAVEEAIAVPRAEVGRLDVLVNNAGGAPRTPFDAMDEDTWRRIVDLNLSSVFHCTRASLPLLRAADAPSVINIASLHAHTTLPGMSAYAAAKGGVVSLTQALAVELAPKVRVNAIAPGLIETEGWMGSTADVEAARAHRLPYIPQRRLGTPSDVGRCVLYLASPASSYMTGATLPVAGGLGLRLYAGEAHARHALGDDLPDETA